MAKDLLESDKAIEAILGELVNLKSATHYVEESAQGVRQADARAESTIASADTVTRAAAELTTTAQKQVHAVAQLAKVNEEHLQQTLAKIEEMNWVIEKVRRGQAANRWLLVVVCLLVLGNVALAIWLNAAQLALTIP